MAPRKNEHARFRTGEEGVIFEETFNVDGEVASRIVTSRAGYRTVAYFNDDGSVAALKVSGPNPRFYEMAVEGARDARISPVSQSQRVFKDEPATPRFLSLLGPLAPSRLAAPAKVREFAFTGND